jgi:hypothetical protein
MTAGPRGNHVEYTNLELLKVVEGNVGGRLRRIRRDTRLELVALEGDGELPGGRLIADPGDPPEALNTAGRLAVGAGEFYSNPNRGAHRGAPVGRPRLAEDG